jgi:hypothetical protein
MLVKANHKAIGYRPMVTSIGHFHIVELLSEFDVCVTNCSKNKLMLHNDNHHRSHHRISIASHYSNIPMMKTTLKKTGKIKTTVIVTNVNMNHNVNHLHQLVVVKLIFNQCDSGTYGQYGYHGQHDAI